MLMEIVAYADGGCSGNPGPGAWAFIVLADGRKFSFSGFDISTTNNRMELTAVIRALEFIASQADWQAAGIAMHTDSQYVQKGISEWIKKWVSNQWKTSAKKPVKNKELWIRLKAVCDNLNVVWQWVRGHSGDDLNEECDAMVKKEMRR